MDVEQFDSEIAIGKNTNTYCWKIAIPKTIGGLPGKKSEFKTLLIFTFGHNQDIRLFGQNKICLLTKSRITIPGE